MKMSNKFNGFQGIKNKQADIILIIGIILISLISFGAGRLTAPNLSKQPLIIQDPTAAMFPVVQEDIREDVIRKDTLSGLIQEDIRKDVIQRGQFVGSLKSNKYHHPDCPFAQKISLENQIWFQSEEEAQRAGYVPCSKLKDYLKP